MTTREELHAMIDTLPDHKLAETAGLIIVRGYRRMWTDLRAYVAAHQTDCAAEFRRDITDTYEQFQRMKS